MKKMVTALFIVAAVAFLARPVRSYAQTADTMWVQPQMGLLNDVINGDTTNSGARNNPNRIYMLYDDSTYYWTGTINVKNYDLTMSAPVPAAGHKPPMVYPGILSDNSVPVWFVESFSGPVTLTHLYLSGTPPDNRSYGASRVLVATSGDSNTVFRVDSCVFDDWYFRTVTGGGKRNSYYITNCVFENLMYPGGPFDGDGFGELNAAITDTLWMTDNTFFCVNSYLILIQDASLCQYIRFEHNTVFLTAVNPLWIFEAVNADIKNNIFYGTFGTGQEPAEITAGYYDYNGQSSSTISLDTLRQIGPKYNVAESDRHIVVENNAYAWPQELTDWYTHWNDSIATAGLSDTLSLTPPSWMNPRTAGMFADHNTWPNLAAANNDSVDPGFPTSAMGQVSKLINYTYYYRTGDTLSATYEWWDVPQGQAGPYPGTWPLAYSLAYSNTALQSAGTDGKALGDLNWFPDQLPLAVRQVPPTTPTKFALSDNYPNPFNPSTIVKVTLAQSGVASLRIYNVLGQLVKVVDQGYKPAGAYTYDINMDQYASGVYFYSLQQGSNLITKKMLLLK